MKKEYTFDESCDFDGITKEEIIAGCEQWDNEREELKIGDYTCKIHPVWKITCKETTGREYEEVLDAVIREFSDDGTVRSALVNIYKFYDEDFDENNEESLSGTIDYIMTVFISDIQNVLDGKLPRVNSFKEMLIRDRDIAVF